MASEKISQLPSINNSTIGPNSLFPVVNSTDITTYSFELSQMDIRYGRAFAPTQQIFTASGTYTLPSSPATPLYLRVRMCGGGGGGAGENAGGGSVPGTMGGTSSFGSILTCTGGGPGTSAGGDSGGTGGSGSISSPAYGSAFIGGQGGGSDSALTSVYVLGGAGGLSLFLGGAGSAPADTGGASAAASSGAGGAGSSSNGGNGQISGSGGGGGGAVDAIIPNPSSTYAVTIGTGGPGGSGGGAGGGGYVEVTEYYS